MEERRQVYYNARASLRSWLRNICKTAKVTTTQSYLLEVLLPVSKISWKSCHSAYERQQIWGTQIYTLDSDIIAVLLFEGYLHPCVCFHKALPSRVKELRVLLQIVKAPKEFVSSKQNGVKSRTWRIESSLVQEEIDDPMGGADKIAMEKGYSIDKVTLVTYTGDQVVLDKNPGLALAQPMVVPALVDRAVHTRGNLDRKQRSIPDIQIEYSLMQEPWIKYEIYTLADRGPKRTQMTSLRFEKEVLYLETHNQQFEICVTQPEQLKAFSFNNCSKAYSTEGLRKRGIPLQEEHINQIQKELEWTDFVWTADGVWVKNVLYPISRILWLKKSVLANSS